MASQPVVASWQSKPGQQNIVAAMIALAASAALFFFETGLHPIWWLVWFAPVPVLVVSPRIAGRRAFALAALAWFAGSMNMWRYFLKALLMPLAPVLMISVIPALLFGLAVLAFRRFVVRGELWKAALIFPSFWVSVEYLNNITSRHGTFWNLAYTQMDFLPVLQIASVVGIWGVSFCLFLFAATLAALLAAEEHAGGRAPLALIVGTILACVLGFGWWRLASTPPAKQVKVGLLAGGVNSPYPQDDAAALDLLRDYADKAESLAGRGAQ